MPTDELAVAITMLDDILHLRRKDVPATMPADEAAIVTAAALAPAPVPLAPMPPATIPAPPAIFPAVSSFSDGDNDPEIEIDAAGNITALTTSVQLPAAAPPAPPAPVAAAPSAGIPAATPLPPGPAVAAELDSRGYPWDGRIHASNRAKKIDGSWKNKRGVDANLVVACEAQNKPGNATIVAPAAAATAIPAATVPVSSTATSAPFPPTAPPPPSVPAAPSGATPPAVPSTVTAPIDFRGLMQKIQAMTQAGKLSTDQVNAALAGVGLKPEEMAQLIGNTLYIASINAAIDACLA